MFDATVYIKFGNLLEAAMSIRLLTILVFVALAPSAVFAMTMEEYAEECGQLGRVPYKQQCVGKPIEGEVTIESFDSETRLTVTLPTVAGDFDLFLTHTIDTVKHPKGSTVIIEGEIGPPDGWAWDIVNARIAEEPNSPPTTAQSELMTLSSDNDRKWPEAFEQKANVQWSGEAHELIRLVGQKTGYDVRFENKPASPRTVEFQQQSTAIKTVLEDLEERAGLSITPDSSSEAIVVSYQ